MQRASTTNPEVAHNGDTGERNGRSFDSCFPGACEMLTFAEEIVPMLAGACRIFGRIMTEAEAERARERIDVVRRMDLIGQAVSSAIRDLERSVESMARATSYSPF